MFQNYKKFRNKEVKMSFFKPNLLILPCFPENKTRLILIFTSKYDTKDYFHGKFYFDISKNEVTKWKLRNFQIKRNTEKDLLLVTINMFFMQTLINNNLFENNHIILLWTVLQVINYQSPLSTKAYLRVGLTLKSSSKITPGLSLRVGLMIGETR